MMPKGMVLVLSFGLAGTRLVRADVPLPSSVAEKVIVLKSERKLMLMKSDPVLKTYRIVWAPIPLAQKPAGEITRRRKVATCSIGIMSEASFTARFTSPIQTQMIGRGPGDLEFRPNAGSLNSLFRSGFGLPSAQMFDHDELCSCRGEAASRVGFVTGVAASLVETSFLNAHTGCQRLHVTSVVRG